jgi:predicted membrane-bound mannosyltransferase
MLLFTTFLTNPHGLQDGIVEGVRYWLSQQPVNRGSQPWFYYLVLLPAYEWPVVLLAAVGTVAVVRRPSTFGAFLVWCFAASLVVYSWASERMPWLVLHPLLPAVLLAGLGFQTLWTARGRPAGKAALAVAAVGASYSVLAAVGAAYVRPADPRELLVQVQSSTDVPGVADEVARLNASAERRLGRPLQMEVDSWGGTGWPWGWYLRNLPVGYPDMSKLDYTPRGDLLLLSDPNHDRLAGQLHDYSGRRFRLRVWWVPAWGAATVGDWIRWLVLRRAWSPRASMDEWLYVRRGLLPPAQGACSRIPGHTPAPRCRTSYH